MSGYFDENELMSSENPFDLVLYAAKCALKAKGELQKFHYLRKTTELLAERGWSQNDKRDLLLFLERITNLTDKALIAQYAEYQRELEKEGKILAYVSIIEREGIEQGIKQGIEQGKQIGSMEEKRLLARRMLARRMPVNKIAELTELSESEIRGLMN